MDKNFTKRILNIILMDFFVYGILYFPVWWYSRGLYKALLKCLKIFSDSWESLGLSIHIRYLLKPMYGQRDITGILISFFMRIIMLIFKVISIIFVFIFCTILFMLWAFLPVIIVLGIVANYKFLTQK